MTAPSVADDARFMRWYARYERLTMPSTQAGTMYRWVERFDVRAVLPSIQAPTLVFNVATAGCTVKAYGQFLAQAIAGAKYVELPGADSTPFFVNAEDVLDEIETFLTGTRAAPRTDRQLATVLFTDIVDFDRPRRSPGRRSLARLALVTPCRRAPTARPIRRSRDRHDRRRLSGDLWRPNWRGDERAGDRQLDARARARSQGGAAHRRDRGGRRGGRRSGCPHRFTPARLRRSVEGDHDVDRPRPHRRLGS